MFGNSFDHESGRGKRPAKKLRRLLANLGYLIPIVIVGAAVGGLVLIVRHSQQENPVERTPIPVTLEPAPEKQIRPEIAAPSSYAEAIRRWKSAGDHETRDQLREWMEKLTNTGPTAEERSAAHLWLAKDLQKKTPTVWPLDRAGHDQSVELHLRRAASIDIRNEEAHAILARHYHNQGRREDALNLLKDAVSNHPGLGTLLAETIDVTREPSKIARAFAERAASHWRQQLEKDANDVNARVQLALSETLLDKDDLTETILTENPRVESAERDSLYNELEVSYRLRQTVRALRLGLPGTEEALTHLEKALELAPDNAHALIWLSDLGVNNAKLNPRVRAILAKLAQQETAIWRVHLALGLQSLPSEDYTTAAGHFAKAYAIHPHDPILANNYAWCLANAKEPKLEDALRVIDQMIEGKKDWRLNPEIFETRGTILVLLGLDQMKASQEAQPAPKLRGKELIMAHSHRPFADLPQAPALY